MQRRAVVAAEEEALAEGRHVGVPAAESAKGCRAWSSRWTARELEVLELVAAGRSNRLIGEELVVTLDTVKKHVGRLLAKLGAANRTEAVARASERGMIG